MGKHIPSASTKQIDSKPLLKEANLAIQAGQISKANKIVNEVLINNPDDPEALNVFAIVLIEAGQLNQAMEKVNKAIEIAGPKIYFCLTAGTALRIMGRPADALKYYELAIKNDPSGNAMLFNDIGLALVDIGDYEKAYWSYLKAMEVQPDFIQAWINSGKLLGDTGNYEKALETLTKANGNYPGNLDIIHGLADLYIKMKDYEQAIEYSKKAISVNPDLTETIISLSQLYHRIGDHQEAINILHKLKSSSESALIQEALLFPHIMQSKEDIDSVRKDFYRKLDDLEKRGIKSEFPEKQVKTIPFHQGYHGRNNKKLMIRLAQFFSNISPHLLYTAPHCLHPRIKKNKIRVGVVSEYFYGHVVSKCFNKLISSLAKEEGIEVIILAASSKRDASTAKLQEACGNYYILPGNIRDAQKAVASHQCDILFYLDIGMSTFSYFLAFARLAPVQCTTGGHPITSGIANMDYFLSCEILEPENGQEHYSEKIITFKNNVAYNEKPKLAEGNKTREELGLPEEDRLYALPVALFRIHPDMDKVFADILTKDEQAKIILFEHFHKTLWRKLLEKRFAKTIPSELQKRIIFVPYAGGEKFIYTLRNMDSIMDPFHFSFGTTIFPLITDGLPFVTLEGEFMRGRAAYWAYKKMGVEGLAAKTPDEYVDIAIKLANDKNFKKEKSNSIKENNDVIFENTAVIKELGEFIKTV